MMINKLKYFSNTKQTPFYVFDFEILKDRIEKLMKLKTENVTLCYAIKANPFLIPALKDYDLLFEVCSPGELSICQKYNLDVKKIVFSGVCKTYEDIQKAYLLQVNTITLESPAHCDYLISVIKNHPKEIHNQNVILRLSSGNQFGMSEEDLENSIDKLLQLNNVKIRGIHYFTGTQKKQKKIEEEIKFITDYCNQLEKSKNLKFENVEYGPGLSFNYFSTENEEDNYEEYIWFMNQIKNTKNNFVIELGRYIASSCGFYVTKIMDVKNIKNNDYCIIDGGINHINYYGQMLGMKIPPVVQLGSNSGNSKKYTICGSLCTTADVIIRELELSEPKINDLLVFKNIGAYSITEGIYLFLSHYLPAVYIYEKEEFTLIRNQIETFEINS